MKQIFLIDLVGDNEGHYFIMKALEKIQGTAVIDTKEIKLHKDKFFKCLFERYKMLNRVRYQIKRLTKEQSVAHLITGDKFIILPLLFPIRSKRSSILATLHRFPEGKIAQILLKNFSKKINSFIVFSDFMKEELKKIGIYNVSTIPYPSFYDYSTIEEKGSLKKRLKLTEKTIITALGGTRYEKGLDILLESFRYIDTQYKKQLVLNIAGREEDIKKEYIERKSKEYKINVRINLKSLSDREFCENIKITDIMIIPYRKNFRSGASGPMTEAMSLGIPCLFPHDSSLGYYRKFNIGKTFKCEDSQSLAMSLNEMIQNKYIIDKNVTLFFTNQGFIENHEKLYNQYYESIRL